MNKKSFVILLVCLVSSLAIKSQIIIDTVYFSNNGQAVNQYDSNGYYRVIAMDTVTDFHFLVKEYTSSHNISMQGVYRSLNPDKKNGKFTWYYPDGNKKKECFFENNKLVGEYKVWYTNKNLKQLSIYKNGLLKGISKTWSETGKIQKYVEYKEGLKHGKFITYYTSGKPLRVDTYKNDNLIKGECFTSNGKDTTYFKYFTPPTFLGGDISTFTSWVLDKLQYPHEAEKAKEEGEVKVKFTIKNNGEVSSIFITKRDKPYFNSEVIKVITTSPNWTPAFRDKDSVDVTIELPVVFKLPGVKKD
jgi:TonB family protein